MCVFGYIDISLPKEPSTEVGLWKMSTENLFISICMKVATNVTNQSCWMGRGNGSPTEPIGNGCTKWSTNLLQKSENAVRYNKPDVLITQAYDSETVPITVQWTSWVTYLYKHLIMERGNSTSWDFLFYGRITNFIENMLQVKAETFCRFLLIADFNRRFTEGLSPSSV